MAKKSFDISSTLHKNRDASLAPKIPLKKKEKNPEEVEQKVATIHSERSPQVEAKQTTKKTKPKKEKSAEKTGKLVRLTIDTPESMHRKLKIRSIERGISMRDYILQLLEKELTKG